MKKTRILIAVIIIFIFSSLLLSCQVNKDDNNIEDEFKNAYALYVAYQEANNLTAVSYEEWLKTIKGEKGDKGDKGDDGITPHIGSNGNWFIGDTDTNIKALASDGITPHIGSNGNWFIGDTDTNIKASASNGENGLSIIDIQAEYVYDNLGNLVLEFRFRMSDNTYKIVTAALPKEVINVSIVNSYYEVVDDISNAPTIYLNVLYDDYSSKNIPLNNSMITSGHIDFTNPGSYPIEISCFNQIINCTIEIYDPNEVTIDWIMANNNIVLFLEDGVINEDYSALNITSQFSDGTQKTINPADCQFVIEEEIQPNNNYIVNASYEGYQFEVNIYVTDQDKSTLLYNNIDKITINDYNENYVINEQINLGTLRVSTEYGEFLYPILEDMIYDTITGEPVDFTKPSNNYFSISLVINDAVLPISYNMQIIDPLNIKFAEATPVQDAYPIGSNLDTFEINVWYTSNNNNLYKNVTVTKEMILNFETVDFNTIGTKTFTIKYDNGIYSFISDVEIEIYDTNISNVKYIYLSDNSVDVKEGEDLDQAILDWIINNNICINVTYFEEVNGNISENIPLTMNYIDTSNINNNVIGNHEIKVCYDNKETTLNINIIPNMENAKLIYTLTPNDYLSGILPEQVFIYDNMIAKLYDDYYEYELLQDNTAIIYNFMGETLYFKVDLTSLKYYEYTVEEEVLKEYISIEDGLRLVIYENFVVLNLYNGDVSIPIYTVYKHISLDSDIIYVCSITIKLNSDSTLDIL